MWCWRRPNVVLEKAKCGAEEGQISWTDRVRNEAVLQTVEEERNVIYTVNKKKDG